MGRIGESNIYEYSKSRLGVIFVPDVPRAVKYNRFQAACLAAGMTQVQSADGEGAFIFDPADSKQANVAIKGIRARVRRQLTPEQRARLANYGFKGQNAQNSPSRPAQEAISSG
jgi:hypothetical protein